MLANLEVQSHADTTMAVTMVVEVAIEVRAVIGPVMAVWVMAGVPTAMVMPVPMIMSVVVVMAMVVVRMVANTATKTGVMAFVTMTAIMGLSGRSQAHSE